MKKFLLLAALISANSFAKVEHSISIIQRPDGQFDVTCIDGNIEVKTKEDIVNNRICTLFNTVEGDWTLTEGGLENGKPMCDLHMNFVRSRDAIFKLTAKFNAPCTGETATTQDCRAMSCSVKLDSKYYAMDFSTVGRMNMTRIEDGLQAAYAGDTGKGGPGGTVVLGNVRTVTMNGVDNIVQVTNDSGATWKAICDDSFSTNEALVACHEMGFSAVDHLSIGIDVNGDNDYGLDDISCQGTENSLFDCNHSAWGTHNCAQNEHVQLTCIQ